MKQFLCRIVIALLCATCLTAYYGPKPVITHQELRSPATPGDPYILVVTIENQSGGEGEAEVTARLHAKTMDETAAQTDQTVTLQPHETAQIVIQLQPPATGTYEAAVEVNYPPE